MPLLFYLLLTQNLFGNKPDSIDSNMPETKLPDVQIIGYLQPQFHWETPVSVGIISQRNLQQQSVVSMVSALNTVPGVRMEERSPGSYRLSIRGSLVRSPYGVRNVKIYYNDFALTDAGENTYLNILNVNDMQNIEVLKGPDGSLFGANSGGVVLLNSNKNTGPALTINAYGGSYGLAGNSIYLAQNSGKHFWTIRQSYQRSDGYRNNSGNYRLFLQASDKWHYKSGNFLEGMIFYSDLDYKTPGGLILVQYEKDPKQSRPPTATMPGSAEQKTRISTRMYFGDIRHQAKITPYLTHHISLWANHVDFVYPFITNYEIRKEDNLGVRTYFTLENPETDISRSWNPSLNIGFEGLWLETDTYNYDNHAGVKGDIQAYNNILNHQYFGFLRGRLAWRDKLVMEAAVSLNYNGYHFRDTTQIKNSFPAVWMPHFAINYSPVNPLSIRLTVSKGYSMPTTAEIRPSDDKVHDNLIAEQGWNTELGFRLNVLNGRLRLDASGFHYLLKDGIISQMDEKGNTFFINSGKIKQLGIEGNGSWIILDKNENRPFLKRLQWNSSYTYSHFYYDSYLNNGNDYSGNRVAGVPRNVFINNLEMDLPFNMHFFLQHNYTSKIPLNDANDEYAKPII